MGWGLGREGVGTISDEDGNFAKLAALSLWEMDIRPSDVN